MAVNGPPPKEDWERQRVNKPQYDTDEVEVDKAPVVRGFPLPEHPDIDWCEHTRLWWDMWRSCPQGKLMAETDWHSLLQGALVHNEIWKPRGNKALSANGLSMLLGELRRREDAFGATWEARKRNRLKIKDFKSPEDDEAEMRQIAAETVDYFDKLTKFAAEAKQMAGEA